MPLLPGTLRLYSVNLPSATLIMRITIAFRHELKYILNLDQQAAVVADLVGHVVPDRHGDAQGAYPITSLYYDTPDYKAYWDKLEGHRNRRKVRVRVYGNSIVEPETPSFVEIKQRRSKLMCKKRVALPYIQAVDFGSFAELAAGVNENLLSDVDQENLREVYYLYQMLQLRPACVVRYHRLAFNGCEPYPDLRVTFDTHLAGRIHDLSLLSTHAQNHACLSPEQSIMEIKVNHTVPYWLTEILARHRCTARRVSKYCCVLEQCGVIAARQRVVVGTR